MSLIEAFAATNNAQFELPWPSLASSVAKIDEEMTWLSMLVGEGEGEADEA